jgi:hypothetical protein
MGLFLRAAFGPDAIKEGASTLNLSAAKAPFDIALPYGLSVTVKPLTTAGMAAAQTAARRAVEAIERQTRERTEAGLALDGLPDLSAEGERDGFYQAQLIRELAIRHITGWTGVDLNGGPALWRMIPVTGSPGGMLIDRRSGPQPAAHLPAARRGLPAAAAPQISRGPSKGEQHWRSRRRHGTSAPKLCPQATLTTQVAQ